MAAPERPRRLHAHECRPVCCVARKHTRTAVVPSVSENDALAPLAPFAPAHLCVVQAGPFRPIWTSPLATVSMVCMIVHYCRFQGSVIASRCTRRVVFGPFPSVTSHGTLAFRARNHPLCTHCTFSRVPHQIFSLAHVLCFIHV